MTRLRRDPSGADGNDAPQVRPAVRGGGAITVGHSNAASNARTCWFCPRATKATCRATTTCRALNSALPAVICFSGQSLQTRIHWHTMPSGARYIMPTRNVVLTDHQARLVERLVVSGRYQNASEVLREGFRLVECQEAERAARLHALREAAASGFADIDAGNFRRFEALEPLRDHLKGLATETLADLDSAAASGDRRSPLAGSPRRFCRSRLPEHPAMDGRTFRNATGTQIRSNP